MAVTGFDLVVGGISDVIGHASSAGKIPDVVTSVGSAIYDSARLLGELPTWVAVGFYLDDQGTIHIVGLNYAPAPGGETLHLGSTHPFLSEGF